MKYTHSKHSSLLGSLPYLWKVSLIYLYSSKAYSCIGGVRGDLRSTKADDILLNASFILFERHIFKHCWSKAANKDSKFYITIEILKSKVL